MFERLEELTRAKEWLDLFRPLPPAVTEELRGRFEVRLTYHSTAIEGNTLTQSETQIVLEKGVTIGGKSLREHLEVIGHKEALDFVLALADAKEPIGEREIREIHSLVMKGQGNGDNGSYRTAEVTAADAEFRYRSWFQVPAFMGWLVQQYRLAGAQHPVKHAARLYQDFVTIRPFRDADGRVGRLLMNLLLLRAGYPIAVIPVERRTEYADALMASQERGEFGPLLDLVADAVEASLRETLSLCLTAAPWTPVEEKKRVEIASWLGQD